MIKGKRTEEFIKDQLRDLGIAYGSYHWFKIYFNAVEAAEIMRKVELVEFIEELANEVRYV